MKASKTTVEQAYTAFNKRDIDGALLLMTENVSWPKASEGGKIVGKMRSALTGLDNGVSLIMSKRLQ